MDDEHLMNFILLSLKAINVIKEKLRGTNVPKDKFTLAMYGDDGDFYSDDELTETLNNLCDRLYPYMAELLLRDVDLVVRGIDVKKMLQDTFERKEAKEKENVNEEFKLLTNQMISDNDYNFDDMI